RKFFRMLRWNLLSFYSQPSLLQLNRPISLPPSPDLKLHLQSTDYGNFLANEASPLTVSVIDDKLKEKMVVEFRHMRNHAYEPLASFLDFIT
uniref:Uncharacterized protein n=1 Tax=Anolis carolinensis TaxID=28377 RepID=A0A803TMJ5_ANOCA